MNDKNNLHESTTNDKLSIKSLNDSSNYFSLFCLNNYRIYLFKF